MFPWRPLGNATRKERESRSHENPNPQTLVLVIPPSPGGSQSVPVGDYPEYAEGEMSDQFLSALAAMIFVIACAMALGVLYIEWAAPWLIDQTRWATWLCQMGAR